MQWMYLSQKFFDLVGNGMLADFIPIVGYLPTKRVREMKRFIDVFLEKIEKEIREHQVKYDGGKYRFKLKIVSLKSYVVKYCDSSPLHIFCTIWL